MFEDVRCYDKILQLHYVLLARQSIQFKMNTMHTQRTLKPSFHYPSSLPEFTGRQLGLWTRAVNSGSENRALARWKLDKRSRSLHAVVRIILLKAHNRQTFPPTNLVYVENSNHTAIWTSSSVGSEVMSNLSVSAPIESTLPSNSHVTSSSGTKLCLANNTFNAKHVSWLNSSTYSNH